MKNEYTSMNMGKIENVITLLLKIHNSLCKDKVVVPKLRESSEYENISKYKGVRS